MSRAPAADRSRLGTAEALLAACIWGSSGVFTVRLFGLGVPPETIALVRPMIGVALLAAGFLVVHPSRLRVTAPGAILVMGVWGGGSVAIFQIAYQMSIDASGVPATVALLYLSPAIVVALSGPLLREWPGPKRLALVALTVLGVWLTVLGATDVEPRFGAAGVGWGIVGAVTYASYTLYGRLATPRFGAVATAVYSTGAACVLLSVAVPMMSGPLVLPASPRGWLLLAAFGALTIAVAQFLFFDALGRAEASTVAVVSAAEPVVAALLATALLGQGLSALGWLGIALVVGGVAGVGTTRPAPRPRG